MNYWILVQIVMNIFLLSALFIIWIRFSKPAKDDPRLSKGLQLLQSKIAVLEDLSDRTEVQVNQLTSLMEQKIKEIQRNLQEADNYIQKVNLSMNKSMEVAKIFQDKIPHEEIIERQHTIKYVKAARMAHQGYDINDIAKEVDLPMSELEFITKINRDQLMFAEDSLPEWTKDTVPETLPSSADQQIKNISQRDISAFFEPPQTDQMALKKLGEEFRKATQANLSQTIPPPAPQQSVFQQAYSQPPPTQQSVFQQSNTQTTSQIQNTASITPAKITQTSKPSLPHSEPKMKTDWIESLVNEKKDSISLSPKIHPQKEVVSFTKKDTSQPKIRKVEFPRIENLRNP